MRLTSTVALWDGSAMSLQEVRLPSRDDTTLIEVVAAGVCGTDLHVMRQDGIPQAPLSLGHEIVGRIIRKGANLPVIGARGAAEGDLIALAPELACGRCVLCMSFGSHEQLCPHRTVHGFSSCQPGIPFAVGGYATHIELADGAAAVVVPEGMPRPRSVLCEVVAVAIRATEQALAQGSPGLGIDAFLARSVAVLGAGPVGCAVSLVLTVAGLAVTAFEGSAWRAEYAARELGIDVRQIAQAGQDWVADAVRGSENGIGFDVVIDCGGTAGLFADALRLARPGGRVVELGSLISGAAAPVDPSLICRKNLEIVGSVLTPPAAYPEALRLLQRTEIPFDRMVSQTIGLADIESGRLLSELTYMKRVVRPEVDDLLDRWRRRCAASREPAGSCQAPGPWPHAPRRPRPRTGAAPRCALP